MIELLGGHCNAQAVSRSLREAPETVEKRFKLPEANGDMCRVFAYLTKQRLTSPAVISHFAHEHKIYEEKKYHNAVFVGMDENGTPKQASLRSSVSFGKVFRITVANSDTKYSFSHFGNDEKLFVFEAPIERTARFGSRRRKRSHKILSKRNRPRNHPRTRRNLFVNIFFACPASQIIEAHLVIIRKNN